MTASSPEQRRLPASVALLGAAIFAITTAEFSVSGLLDVLAADLRVPIARVGYLVSWYAAGMALGGPLLVLALARWRQQRALALVLVLFGLAQALAALADGYPGLAACRFVQGFCGSAAFGLALSLGARLAGRARQGQAAAWIMGGLMIGTVLGLPLASWLGGWVGWRPVFAALAAVAVLVAVPVARVDAPPAGAGAGAGPRTLADAGLWMVFTTSFLLIGATFAAFTYLVPLLGERAGIPARWIPACLALYGAATVVGNFVCGRWVDRWGGWRVQAVGIAVLAISLALFALGQRQAWLVLPALVLVGLTGVALNPSMVARVMAIDASPLVASVHTTVISAGLLAGSALGGMAIDGSGQVGAALWVALALAVLAWGSLRPARDRPGRPSRPRLADACREAR